LPQNAGNFIYFLIKAINARRILQIGTFGGNNTLWLAAAAKATNGRVTALQCDSSKTEIAKLNFKMAGVARQIQLVSENLDASLLAFRTTFDLMYLDTPIDNYLHYFKLAFPKIRSGGVIITDRAISHQSQIRPFLNYLNEQSTLENVLLPVGKGLILTYKKI
jgi:predicted O-methyltransferase YrrM